MPATLRHELARKSIHAATIVVPIAYARGVAREVVLAALLSPRDAAVAVMCAVSLGYAAAAVVGRAVGRVRLAHGKTLEGAAACATATAVGAALVAGLPLGEC